MREQEDRARPITIVPLMVVALRISVPACIGPLPSTANTTIASDPTVIARGFGRRPASSGRSRATSLESEVKVESSVEPAELTITTIIAK